MLGLLHKSFRQQLDRGPAPTGNVDASIPVPHQALDSSTRCCCATYFDAVQRAVCCLAVLTGIAVNVQRTELQQRLLQSTTPRRADPMKAVSYRQHGLIRPDCKVLQVERVLSNSAAFTLASLALTS